MPLNSKKNFDSVTSTTLSNDLAIFREHFPSSPLYPGYLILNWIKTCVGEEKLNFRRVKFLHPIRPGDTLELMLEVTDSIAREFKVLVRDQIVASGVCEGS